MSHEFSRIYLSSSLMFATQILVYPYVLSYLASLDTSSVLQHILLTHSALYSYHVPVCSLQAVNSQVFDYASCLFDNKI
jgi:hypothetical protein